MAKPTTVQVSSSTLKLLRLAKAQTNTKTYDELIMDMVVHIIKRG